MVAGFGWLSLGVALTCLAACGSTGANNVQSTTGGSAGSASGSAGQPSAGTAAVAGAGAGAGAGGASGTGGVSAAGDGPVLGDTLAEACIAYALASCSRGAECRGSSTGQSSCWSASFSCPDLIASPGSTRTVATLQACAAAYKTFSCDALAAGQLPPCVTPGTRQAGEPCAFPSECASLSCKRKDGCGKCASLVAEGQDCSSPDVDCSPGLACDPSLVPPTCVKISSATAALPGQPCTNSCVTDYRCDSGGTNVCIAYPQLGMSCEQERTCGGDSYCELDGLICKARPGKGAPCGVDGFTAQATYCASGLACHQSTASMGVCETPPGLGDACWLDQQGYSCWDDTTCDLSQQPPVCSARGGPGADCTTGGQLTCMSKLSCMCPPGSTPGVACPTRSCYTLRFAGESCDEPGSACHPAFACTAGKCVPKDSQGLFDAACMP